MSFVCEAEKSEMKVCVCVPLHTVERAPKKVQWHGRTTVSDHLPTDTLESTDVLWLCLDGAQGVNPLENLRAVKCSSTSAAQTVEYSSKSRLRSPEAASLFQVRERECTGLPIGLGKCSSFIIFVMTNLD